jgi:hypothetical protein
MFLFTHGQTLKGLALTKNYTMQQLFGRRGYFDIIVLKYVLINDITWIIQLISIFIVYFV